jgi:hypothetical protein
MTRLLQHIQGRPTALTVFSLHIMKSEITSLYRLPFVDDLAFESSRFSSEPSGSTAVEQWVFASEFS